MSGFADDWLDLREPPDAAARCKTLTDSLRRRWPARPAAVTDLGCGTGSNLRFLGPALGGRQDWTLVDYDAALLRALPSRLRIWASGLGAEVSGADDDLCVLAAEFECRARTLRLDLAAHPDGPDLRHGGLVTASALLDLVSQPWLEALARRCLDARAPVLFALTYDGRMRLTPEHPLDARLQALVNRHQTTDKGFGPALGPEAGRCAETTFAGLGYRVDVAHSDWRLGAGEARLQEKLLDGWFRAAASISAGDSTALEDWHGERRAQLAAGRLEIGVGHVDLLGWPPD